MPRPIKPKNAYKISGFTLIEVLVALGVMSIITVGIADYFVHIQNSRYRIEAMGTRDALALRLRRSINKVNLVYSAQAIGDPGNTTLANCILGLPGSTCTATNAGSPLGFQLGYPRGSATTLVSGSASTPLNFSHTGEICSGQKGCKPEWEARTYFTAICPFSAPSCKQATYVRVGFIIRNIQLQGQPLLPSTPPLQNNNVYTSLAFSSIKISDPPSVTNTCNPNSTVVQVDSQGFTHCGCVTGATATGTFNNQPLCTLNPIGCPNGSATPVGFDQNLKAICTTTLSCTPQQTGTSCQGFITAMTIGGCAISTSADKKKKKGDGDSTTTCAQNSYQCCTAN